MGELTAEFKAECRPELSVEIEDVGEIRDMHSGGLVVLRYGVGRAGGARPGGLYVFERARRWTLVAWKDEGSRVWSWVLILGSRSGPCRRTGEGVVRWVSTDSTDDAGLN